MEHQSRDGAPSTVDEAGTADAAASAGTSAGSGRGTGANVGTSTRSNAGADAATGVDPVDAALRSVFPIRSKIAELKSKLVDSEQKVAACRLRKDELDG